MWQLVTDLDQKKQALAVTLCLSGRAREAALEIKAEELNTNDGMKILLTKLDSVFQKDSIDLAYVAYTLFEQCKRHESTSITDHIVEFERKYNQIKKYKMALPEPVLAFKLLDNAGLSQKERQLVLTATSTSDFSSMKSALKRILEEALSVVQETLISRRNSYILHHMEKKVSRDILDKIEEEVIQVAKVIHKVVQDPEAQIL